MKLTMSLCPVCYKEIPAMIDIKRDNTVWMTKQCIEHGTFYAMVERDARWYNNCQVANDKSFYDSYLIDITSKCNLSCRYCFHKNGKDDTPVNDIIKDAIEHKHLAPLVLTGGEPTLHPHLIDILKALKPLGTEITILTNGIKLLDEDYLNGIIPYIKYNGVLGIGLSLHQESDEKDILFLELLKQKKEKICSAFAVIDRLEQIDDILKIYEEYKDVIVVMRIKAASNLWNEHGADTKIFVSDMINYLADKGKLDIISGINDEGYKYNNKNSFVNAVYNGLQLMLVSWYDVGNVDLNDINCAPYTKDKCGNVSNLATAFIMNGKHERDNGYIVRRAELCDLPICGELWKGLVLDESPTLTPNVNMWCEQMFQYMKNPNAHVWVGEYKGEIVGMFAGSTDHYDPITTKRFIVGDHFYIKPEHRDTAIGKMLHNRYKDIGRKLGIKKVIRTVTLSKTKYLMDKGQMITHEVIEEIII